MSDPHHEISPRDTFGFWLLALAIVGVMALATTLFGLPGLTVVALVMVAVIWGVLLVISRG